MNTLQLFDSNNVTNRLKYEGNSGQSLIQLTHCSTVTIVNPDGPDNPFFMNLTIYCNLSQKAWLSSSYLDGYFFVVIAPIFLLRNFC